MAPQNADKHGFRGQQNGHCIQQVTRLPGDFPHVFTDKVPALFARKSRVPRHSPNQPPPRRQFDMVSASSAVNTPSETQLLEARLAQVEEALRQARADLAYAARVMSLGTLSASIAHEIKQPLSGIITNAGTCLPMLAADPPDIAGARTVSSLTYSCRACQVPN